MERTLVLLKPDAVKRKLVGKIIERIEDKKLDIDYLSLRTLNVEELKYHYAEHVEKPFFPSLCEYMSSGPVVIMVVKGENAISALRKMSGATDPLEADAGSIRGMYAPTKSENVIHSSDSEKSADREINFFVKGIME
ncbi:MAG: nucleoside-diphosphate kinase [Eubacteriaceae bacterium]|nr:nucleoside-diphosphate kinase [Eubacteriaceae bacterium]